MLSYLEEKKAVLEARKAVKSDFYPDIDEQVEAYRQTLYTARNEAIEQSNMLIDAQVAILDEVIEETAKAMETANETETVEITDIVTGTVDEIEGQKEVEY